MRIMREMVEAFLAVGDEGALTRRADSVGGDALPSADLASWTASRLGESLTTEPLVPSARNWLSEFATSKRLCSASTLDASWAWSVFMPLSVLSISTSV